MTTPQKKPASGYGWRVFLWNRPVRAGPAVLHLLDQAKVSSTLVSFSAELEAEPEDPPVVVLERMSPLASLTMVVMDPSALKTCVVVVEDDEDEEELPPDADELADVEEEEEVPNRLLTALLPLRLVREEDMEDASLIAWFEKTQASFMPTGPRCQS